MIISPAKSLNREDINRWLHNATVFIIPAILVLLASFTKIIPVDASWGVIALYIINVLTDLIKKWASENKYK